MTLNPHNSAEGIFFFASVEYDLKKFRKLNKHTKTLQCQLSLKLCRLYCFALVGASLAEEPC